VPGESVPDTNGFTNARRTPKSRKKAHHRRGLEEPGASGEGGCPIGAGSPIRRRPYPAAARRPRLFGQHAVPARAIALGLLPNPVTNKPDVRIDQAKHTVDTLAMLQQKTEGNRTPEESDELEAALHQLRLAYIDVTA